MTESDFTQIRELEIICNQAEKIAVKLNWGLMKMREPGKTSDFCHYAQGKLVGYMPVDGFGDQFEITAIVHPDYRRQGILQLLQWRKKSNSPQRRRLLLVNYRNSVSGNALVAALGLPYHNSEYHMETDRTMLSCAACQPDHLLDDSRQCRRSVAIAGGPGAGRWNSEAELLADLAREDGNISWQRMAP